MTTNSPILSIPKRLPIWFSLNYSYVSYALAPHVPAPSEVGKGSPDSTEFISVVQVFKDGLHPHRLIHVLDSTSDVTLALKAFKWASMQKKFWHTAETYAHMILKLGMVGKHEEMEILLNEVVKLQLQDTEQAFDYLIRYFCGNYRPVEALQVFKCSILAKHSLSISTCNKLLDAFSSQSGNFCSLMFVYKEMVKARILPVVETLNYLIKGLCNVGRLDLALNQLQRMSKKLCDPNSQTFEILIRALCINGRADDAVEVLNQMLEVGCTPHRDFYCNVVPLLCSVKKFEGITLFRMKEVSDGGLDLYLCSYLIQYLCVNQQIVSAIELLQEIKGSGFAPLTSMYVDIVDALCKTGMLTEATSFLEGEDVLHVEPHNALLLGFSNAGRCLEAVTYLKKMAERGLTNFLSWNLVIKVLCQEGFIRQAFEIIGRMIISSCVAEGTIFSAVIIGYCKIGEYENALGMFRLSCVHDYSLDSESCSVLIEGLCIGNKVQDGAEVFYHVTSKGCQLSKDATSELVQMICYDGKVLEAIRIRSLAISNGSSCNSVTHSTILRGLLDLGKPKDSLVFLSKMIVEGYTLDVQTYCILIHGLCSNNITKEAVDLFDKMVHDDLIHNSEILELLIFRFARNSLLHMVVHSLECLISDGALLTPTVCNMVIYSLVKEGHMHGALKFLDWMLDKGWVPDANTHVLLVGNSIEEQRNEKYDAFRAPHDDNVSKILVEGLDDFDQSISLR